MTTATEIAIAYAAGASVLFIGAAAILSVGSILILGTLFTQPYANSDRRSSSTNSNR
jgi:hypothetical protein